MSTRAFASAIIPLPIEKVWAVLRDFTFPKRLISGVESVEILEGKAGDSVGATRVMKWAAGGVRQHRLLELSDLYHFATWELVFSDPPSEAEGHISLLRCFRISETNQTLVEWSADFSADVKGDLILYEQKAYAQNLKDIREHLTRS